MQRITTGIRCITWYMGKGFKLGSIHQNSLFDLISTSSSTLVLHSLSKYSGSKTR